jgi:hypothetical protein
MRRWRANGRQKPSRWNSSLGRFLLYVTLHYAYHGGMAVTMAPPTEHDQPHS